MLTYGKGRVISGGEVDLWGSARFIGAIAAFVATIALGNWLDAWPHSWTSPITSPLTAILSFGLPLFPGGTFLVLNAVHSIARARAARSWPVARGRVIASRVETTYGGNSVFYAPVVLVSYTVEGASFETSAIHFGRARYFSEGDAQTVVDRYPARADVDVHYDSADPETGIVEFEQGIGRRNLWIGVGLLVLPFVLAYPIVWHNGS